MLIISFCLTTNIYCQVEFTQHDITVNAEWAFSVYAVDVDGDSDMDVLSASADDSKIAWYENDGNENFTTHTITTDAIYGPGSVYAADCGRRWGYGCAFRFYFSMTKVFWYENDGNENFYLHIPLQQVRMTPFRSMR